MSFHTDALQVNPGVCTWVRVVVGVTHKIWHLVGVTHKIWHQYKDGVADPIGYEIFGVLSFLYDEVITFAGRLTPHQTSVEALVASVVLVI